MTDTPTNEERARELMPAAVMFGVPDEIELARLRIKIVAALEEKDAALERARREERERCAEVLEELGYLHAADAVRRYQNTHEFKFEDIRSDGGNGDG